MHSICASAMCLAIMNGGWLQWMKTAFVEGEIHDYWKNSIQPQKWFDPAFISFINKEVIKDKL